MGAAVTVLEQHVREALFDDLNSPRALAAVFNFVRAANADLDRNGGEASAISYARNALRFIENTLGIVPPKRLMGVFPMTISLGQISIAIVNNETPDESAMRSWVESRLAERAAARAVRDFARADAVRDELASKGIQIKDSGVGTTWKKVS
jgi:cysteinyl-tRNA synthetase